MASYLDQFSAESILVIKRPPVSAPAIQSITTAGEDDFLEERFISFAYRYKYADGEYSATSQFSEPSFIPNPFDFSFNSYLNEGMTNSTNACIITFNSGGPLVVGIDLLFKESNSSTIKVIEKLNKSNEGYVIALPHLGNWEFAIPFGKELNLNLLAVAEPLSDKNILDWFKNLRENLGCEIILGGKGQNTFDNLVKKIESGYHVCLLSERHIANSGIGVEFFNRIAAFPKGAVALSLKTQVPIVPAAFLHLNNKFQLVFGTPFIVPYFDNEAQSIQHGLNVLARELEKLILLDPNQWHSIQPVWTSEY